MEVIIATIDVIATMQTYYKEAIQPSVPQGGVFTAKISGCTITAYKSGKVMFQGAQFTTEVDRWRDVTTPKPAAKPKLKSSNLPSNISTLSAIGSDEVGTGDYFGPMIVASAYVDDKHIPILKELGVRDSKDLKDDAICAIAKKIIKIIPYSLLTLPNMKYNELQQKGMNQGKLKATLHNQAICNLVEKIAPVKPEAILIDQFCEPTVYFNYLKGKSTIATENVYFSTKAESVHIAVAAASIIARYAFVKRFEELNKQAGFTLPKGAGALVDKAAAKLIKKNGTEILQNFAKVHFANTEKSIKIANKA